MNHGEKRIAWDPGKNQTNKKKHKIGFEEAATVFYDPLSLTVDDPEHSEYERRLHIIGESNKGRLVLVRFSETEKRNPDHQRPETDSARKKPL